MNAARFAALGLLLALSVQEAGPGSPEDVAELLPADTCIFAELVRAPKLLQSWRDFAGSVCTPAGKAKVIPRLEKALEEALAVLPEKLLKDLEKGLPGVQRIAFALTGMGGTSDPQWMLVATSSDAEFPKRIVDEDLRVFAGEEKSHHDVRVLAIRKLGELRFPTPLWVAAAGKRLIVAGRWAGMESALDRAAKRSAGGDLRSNEMYRKLAATGDDPVLRGFAAFPWDEMDSSTEDWGYRKVSAHGMDQADAALGFRRIRGAIVEASFRPGRIATSTRVVIEGNCPLYEVFRQPAGPKEALGLVPADAQVLAHVNLKGGKEVWADIRRLIQRYQQVALKGAPRDLPPEAIEQDLDRELDRELGVKPAELAGAIADEAAFAMVGDEALTGDRQMLDSLLFVVKGTDSAKEVLAKIVGRIGGYEEKTEGAALFHLPKGDDGEKPVFALQGKTVLIGSKADTLRKALKAGAERKTIAAQLPGEIAKASKLFAVRNRAVWSVLARGLGPRLPDVAGDLDLDALSTILFHEEKSELRLASADTGAGLNSQIGVVGAPFLFWMAVGVRAASPFPDEEEERKPAPVKESPPLPADQLAAAVKKQLAALKAEEVLVRDDAEIALRTLGRQAAALLVEAARKETDSEVKGRLLGLLTAWKAYDVMPELLKGKVEAYLDELRRAGEQGDAGKLAEWDRDQAMFPFGLEPDVSNLHGARRLKNRDLLDSPEGVRALAARVKEGGLAPALARNLAAIFAYGEAKLPSEPLLAALRETQDGETKAFLLVAVGKADDAKGREVLYAALKDREVWTRRAAFLGVERLSDPAAVALLLGLLDDADAETRWQASFTLRKLTRGRIGVNVYWDEAELKAGLAAARGWWEANRAGFRVGR
jgi:hypothetical protein